jgi:hypothetical protein
MKTQTTGVFIAGLLLLAAVVTPAWAGLGQGGAWLEWLGLETLFTRDKGYSRSYGSYFEASIRGRWVAQVWKGVQIVKGEPPDERFAGPVKGTRVIEPRCVVIWEVGADGRLVRPVWNSEDKDFVVLNVKWVGEELLLSVLYGTRNVDDVPREIAAGKSPLLLAVQPETGQVRRFMNVDTHIILAHPAGDRVLLGRSDYLGDNKRELWFGVYTYPEGQGVASFRFDELKVFGTFIPYSYVLGWADADHIWALGEREGPKLHPTLPRASVSVLFSIDLQGKIRMVSGDPKSSWVQWPGVWLAGETEGLSYYTMPPQVLNDGRLAVMMGGKPRLALFGVKGSPKECHFRPKEYPERLRQVLQERRVMGQRTRALAITPDGRKLILQEGERGPELDLSQPLGVWAWDLESNQLEKLGEVGYIETTFGWLQKEYLMISVYGGNRGRYGVVHISTK